MKTAKDLVNRLIEADELPGDIPDPLANPDELVKASNNSNIVLKGYPVALYHKWKDMMRGRRLVPVADVRNELGGFSKSKGTTASYLVDNGDMIALKLHDTDVIQVYSDNHVVVSSGGYVTLTTGKRINCISPGGWGVYAKNGSFYWSNIRLYKDPELGKAVIKFTDGDIIMPDGTLKPQAQIVIK
jgi:uncharacterized protein YehS (DUF1456 family)